MLKIDALKPRAGARRRRRRVGRGLGSGSGVYAGRGRKGQKARAGSGPRPGVEGGPEPPAPARAFSRQIKGAVARRELALSAAQRLDLLRRLLPGITAQEISRAFAANFAATNVTFIAKLPSGGDLPDETELISLGRQALNVKPERQTEVT